MHISQPKCIYLKVKIITLTVLGEILWPFHAFQSIPGCSLGLKGPSKAIFDGIDAYRGTLRVTL